MADDNTPSNTDGGVEVAHLGQSNDDPESNNDSQGQDPQSQEPANADGGSESTNDDAQSLDDLPEYWQKQIRDLRKENAERRTANRDDKDSQIERIAALESELEARQAAEQEAKANAEKTQMLADRGLDSKRYLSMLTGDDPKAWEEAADSLAELRGSNGPRLDPVQVAASKQSHTKSDKERTADAFFAGLDNK